MIEWVFFDAGETLLRPEPSFPERLVALLAGRGHTVTVDQVLEASRRVAHHFRRAADANHRWSVSDDASHAFWTALYREMLEHLGIDDADAPEVFFGAFRDPRSYGLFDDVKGCLDALSAGGYRLGIVSNFEAFLEDVLEHLGVGGRFEVIAISGHLGLEKPDPEIFRWALERAGAPPECAAYVGDQPYFDAEAAIAVGMRGVLLDRHDRWGDLDASYPVVSSLVDVPGVVDRLAPARG